MKKIIFFCLSATLLAACGNEPTIVRKEMTIIKNDSLDGDKPEQNKTVFEIDQNGKKFKAEYDNKASTAVVTFNGETINLKQDTTASGTQYSNKNYILTDWHGITELKKDGKSIFKHEMKEMKELN